MTKEIKTTDLSDAHPDALRYADPVFHDFGGRAAFHGPASTLKVFEDNTLVRAALETPGQGQVLVVDGGGSLRCALVGGLLAELGEKNGWAGIVVNGCVRDRDEIRASKIGVKALSSHPRKSHKRGEGQADLPVQLPGCTVNPGDWVYADEDGLVVAREALSA